jgi:DNA-binding transcriptional MerR regulator
MMSEPALQALTPIEIPNKLYFRIGDVARLTGVKPYVLRFWETEFPGLGPKKSGTGQRLYRRKDVELVLEIKRLLYEKRFTIEGARKWLEDRPKPVVARTEKKEKKAAPVVVTPAPVQQQGELFSFGPPAAPGVPVEKLQAVRRELEEILRLLER